MKLQKIICLFLSLWTLSLYSESGYVFCIEGGGSKTILQVLNENGQIVPITKNGFISDKIEGGGCNINAVGIEGVRTVLRFLFEDVSVEGTALIHLMPDSRVVAGMAGIALPQNKQAVLSLFEEWGICRDQLILLTDAEMALELVGGEGIILIAGTGSICLGKKEGVIYRVGGLGKVLGDEGSGYQIGLQALKAALAEVYGWGAQTSLTPALKELYDVSDLKSLIPKVNFGEMPYTKIASSSPLVFSKAWEGDPIAQGIIDRAAQDLGALLAGMLQISKLSGCEVYLFGGVFKNVYADAFIEKIREPLPDKGAHLRILNQSHQNTAVLFALQKLLLHRMVREERHMQDVE